jgi:hypothetical protein
VLCDANLSTAIIEGAGEAIQTVQGAWPISPLPDCLIFQKGSEYLSVNKQ